MELELGPFEEVADRTYRAVAQPDAVNIGLVVGERGALLVDTGSSVEQGRAIRAAAQAVAGAVPLTHVVVTHDHHDHLGGLDAFADLTTLGHRHLDGHVSRTFELATAVDLGDCYVEVVHFGRGHTDHDVTVLVPARQVVFAGDTLESSGPPVADEDSWTAEWPTSLDGMLGTLRADTMVLPGHGPVMARQDCFVQRAEIAWHQGKAEELYDARRPAQGAWTDDTWPWPQGPTEAFLAAALRGLEASGRPRKRSLPLLGR